MGDRLLTSVVRGAIPLSIGAPRTDFRSGCSTMEVTFPNLGAVEIGEIQFGNYYVAFLTIRVKLKGGEEEVWRTLVKNKRLMPDPHGERGSQDYFVITRKHLPSEVMDHVTALRFVLRQPSPVWEDFYLDDVKIYAPPGEPTSAITLPEFLKREENAQRKPDKAKMANIVLPNVQAVSMELQQLWGLTELLKANQSTVGAGRYDVDGSYDINLLSYA